MLLNYLNSLPFGVDLAEHFADTFGVIVKREDNLALFKYGLGAVWGNPITYQCRGAILAQTSGGWEWRSRPFDKFFNLHEGHCPLFSDAGWARLAHECYAFEKVDGSCIQVWYDPARDDWRASTLGTITTLPIQGGAETFAEAFWRVSGLNKIGLRPGATYLFELATPANRIVTDYDGGVCAHLATRDNATGDYCALPLVATQGTLRGAHLLLWSPTTKDALYADVEALSAREDLGHNPEGVVLWHPTLGPVAKVKRKAYLAMHRFAEGNPAQSQRALIAAFFAGDLDDIRADLPPTASRWADKLAEGFRDLAHRERLAVQHVASQGPYESRKDYALALKSSGVEFFGFWITEQGGVEQGTLNIEEVFERKMREGRKGKPAWERELDRWKSYCDA